MDKPTENLVESFVNLVHDFHHPVTKDSVTAWLSQFPSEHHYTLMNEMNHLLGTYYISQDKMAKVVKIAFEKLEKEVARFTFANASVTIPQTRFLRISRHGNSQDEVLSLFDELLFEKYGVHTSDCEGLNVNIYIDDSSYTGNTIIYDLQAWIETNNIKNAHIIILPLFSHLKQKSYYENRIRGLCAGREIYVHFVQNIPIDDRRGHGAKIVCYAPQIHTPGIYTTKYLETMELNINSLRGTHIVPGKKIFHTAAGRQCVETLFLEKGSELYLDCTDPAKSTRPLGFEVLKTIGFGTPLIFYRNIANNAPMVLWWAVNGWRPLFMRTTNS